MENFFQFNILEGLFWIFLGIIYLVLYIFVPKTYKKMMISAAILLILFGISDFVETKVGGFLTGPWWMRVWKPANLIGLVGIVAWYVKLRLKSL